MPNMLRKSFVKWDSFTVGYLYEGKRGGGEELCWWVAKFNIQNEEINKLISPIKVILPYFAYVIVAKFHKHTTAA